MVSKKYLKMNSNKKLLCMLTCRRLTYQVLVEADIVIHYLEFINGTGILNSRSND